MSGNIFTVTGLVQSKGEGFSSTDNLILIPLSTLQGMTSSLTTTGEHSVNSISIQAVSDKVVSTVENDITALLESRHNIAVGATDDFTISSTQEITKTLTSSTRA